MVDQQNGQPVAKRLKELFAKDGIKAAVEKVLPKNFRGQSERFLSRALLTFHNSDPKVRASLSKCTPDSFIQSVCTAAEHGFALDNEFAYMIPYGNVCTCMFDYKAIVARARRSGVVQDIRPQVVYEKDEFEFYEENGKQVYRYRPYLDGDAGPMRLTYAVVVFKDGGYRFGYMNKSDLEKVRKASKAPNSPAWTNWADQMWCKAVIRRVAKGLLDDPGVTQLIEHDNQFYDLDKVIDGKVSQASDRRVQSMDDLAAEAERRASPRITEQAEPRDFSEEAGGDLSEAEKEEIMAMERAEAMSHGD